jgi:hypothetical protein
MQITSRSFSLRYASIYLVLFYLNSTVVRYLYEGKVLDEKELKYHVPATKKSDWIVETMEIAESEGPECAKLAVNREQRGLFSAFKTMFFGQGEL